LEVHGTLDFAVRNPGQVEFTSDDPEPGDTDDDGIGDEAAVVPEPANGVGDRRNVLDLTVDDGARRKPDLSESHQFGRARPELELSGAYRTGPYVESYDLLACDSPSSSLVAHRRVF
jgi:hypothetical protein